MPLGLTLGLALLSSLFFAGSDTMVGMPGAAFGTGTFLFTAILLALPRENLSRKILIQRSVGACLLCISIAIVFS